MQFLKKKKELEKIGVYFIYSNIFKILLFIILIGVLLSTFHKSFAQIITSNTGLNILILCVFSMGAIINIKNLINLIPEVKWLNEFFSKKNSKIKPTILSHIKSILNNYGKSNNNYISMDNIKYILEITDDRIADIKTLPNYLVNTLIFLGLLGTFWGLIITIGSVSGVIQNLTTDNESVSLIMQNLKQDLAQPIKGMSVAFSSSLLGLGSSLFLGLIYLITNMTYNSFYNKVEEKFLSLTKIIKTSTADAESVAASLPYMQALIEQNSDLMATLQKAMIKNNTHSEESAKQLSVASKELTKASINSKDNLKIMQRLTTSNEKIMPMLADIVKITKTGFGMDDKTKKHIANTDKQMIDLKDTFEENIKLLAKTINIKKS